MTNEYEIQIYNHFLDLIKNANDLSELEEWVKREMNHLQERINRISKF